MRDFDEQLINVGTETRDKVATTWNKGRNGKKLSSFEKRIANTRTETGENDVTT
jgi:hypothetical protein